MNLMHISSGAVLSRARTSPTEIGEAVKRYYDAGELVPDEITVQLMLAAIHDNLDADLVLLDGFPRTRAQAEALDAALAQQGESIGAVIELVAPMETVRTRLLGRLVCRTCGELYNTLTNPPRTPGVCDNDGGELYQRPDDTPEAIDRRLDIWSRENSDLVAYYDQQGIVHKVDADRPVEEIVGDIETVLRQSGAAR